jgi:hypothetical protein
MLTHLIQAYLDENKYWGLFKRDQDVDRCSVVWTTSNVTSGPLLKYSMTLKSYILTKN